MDVIGAGFGRTGTLSLKLALDQLGFGPCYHMSEVPQEPARIREWLAVARDGDPDWARIFAGYRSTVDWPAASFWRELTDAYPDAPVILTVRDPDAWYASVEQTVYPQSVRLGGLVDRETPPGTSLIETTLSRAQLAEFHQLLQETIWQRLFDGRFTDHDHALSVYHRHIREVRDHLPPDRLLVYDVREGWAPLCAFLGVARPETPFPRTNDRASFNEGTNAP